MKLWINQKPQDDIVGVTSNEDKWTSVEEPNRTRLIEQIKSLKEDLGFRVEKSIDKGRLFAYDAVIQAIDNRLPIAKIVDSLRGKSQEYHQKMIYEGNEEQKKYFQGVILGIIKSTDLIAKRRYPSSREVSFYETF